MDQSIPAKANRVLNIIILGFMLVLIRVWYLAIIQHDVHVSLARKPQRKSVIEHVERATIRDRFNIPMALNKIQYNAAVCYADIRQIPSIRWVKADDGARKREYARSAYIKQLAELLGRELNMEAQTIEDTIHGKASLFPHTPFVIKENVSEEQFYRLKLLEKDWVGIRMERGSVRYYPQGKTGSDIIGYMGAISSNEYLNIAQEMKILQSYILDREAGEMPFLPKGFHNPLEVRERLKQLQEKAYTINDLVGKAGVESYFDEELRGYFGKKIYEIDTKGNFLRELPGSRKALSGQRLLLSISSELQEFAEQLLAENEHFREIFKPDGTPSLNQPWIKGGSIVAMDPHSGEVLALASYPRFDPNDFIPSHSAEIKKQKQSGVRRWLENEAYVGEIWDGIRPLERERFNSETQTFYDETLDLTWHRYLEAIVPEQSPIATAMHKIMDIAAAVTLQTTLEKLLILSGQTDMRVLLFALYGDEGHIPSRTPLSAEVKKEARRHLNEASLEVASAKKIVDAYLQNIPHHDDKLLVVDLCRILVKTEDFSPELLEQIGKQSLVSYRSLCQSATAIQNHLNHQIREWFHQISFHEWREANFKDYLREKRKEEKEKKHYTRPYTEYLEQIEKASFKEFWNSFRWAFLEVFIQGASAAPWEELPELQPYLTRILALRNTESEIAAHADKLKKASAALTDDLFGQYLRSFRSFEELNRPLYGTYRSLRNTNGSQLEKHLAAAFYPLASYGYGRSFAYRQSTPLGSVFKVVVAYQALLEKYQFLDAGHHSLHDINPLTLIDNIQWTAKPGSNSQVLGYSLDGQAYKRLYKGGRLPRSHPNVGKIDLIGALEQSSNLYFPILAAEYIRDPMSLVDVSRLLGFGEKTGIELPGEFKGVLPDDLAHNQTGLYSFAIGQHSLVVTPLQTAVMLSAIANKGQVPEPKIVQLIAGNEPSYDYHDPFDAGSFAFQENLNLIGIDFPLFSATQDERSKPHVWYSAPHIKRSLFMPDEVRSPLVEGMRRVITGPKGTARANIIRLLYENPNMKKNYLELKDQMIGKTGTAEILYKHTIDAQSLAEIRNHIWFSGISFTKDASGKQEPELVIVVYLRLSEAGGKEATPLAFEIVKKWREICAKHGRSAHVLPDHQGQIEDKF